MTDSKLYQYYEAQAFLPTFANFTSQADLDAYEVGRRTLFAERLAIPLRLFRGARLLEFGPDSGENALVLRRVSLARRGSRVSRSRTTSGSAVAREAACSRDAARSALRTHSRGAFAEHLTFFATDVRAAHWEA